MLILLIVVMIVMMVIMCRMRMVIEGHHTNVIFVAAATGQAHWSATNSTERTLSYDPRSIAPRHCRTGRGDQVIEGEVLSA